MDTLLKQFYDGYVEAMLWSSTGGPDYSEAPDGYTVYKMTDHRGWYWTTDHEPEHLPTEDEVLLFEEGKYYASEEEAIASCWEDSGETPPDIESLEDYELSEEAQEHAMADCKNFVEDNFNDLAEYVERRSYDPTPGTVWSYAGHDFWLTRAGHGVGYWDRGLDGLSDRLTAAAKVYGNIDPYVGDDGLVYI